MKNSFQWSRVAIAVLLGGGLFFLTSPDAMAESAEEIQEIKTRLADMEETINLLTEESAEPHLHWLQIGGDIRVRHDYLRGKSVAYRQVTNFNTFANVAVPAQTHKQDSLLTTRVGLNLKAQALESVTVKARILMYKAFGSQDSTPVTASYFADRTSVFDGTIGHIPSDNKAIFDYAYFDWSNIGGYPVWFSAGRRPSAGGVPTNIRRNEDHHGISGTTGLLVDYAFDGFTAGAMPDIASLPGFAGKICYGRAFQSDVVKETNDQDSTTLKNTDMLGLVFLPYDSGTARFELQYQRGFNIMDNLPGPNVTQNLGDIENMGGGSVGIFENAGPGDLRLFLFGAMSKTHPNDNLLYGSGLLYDMGNKKNRTGYGVYTGARYDFPTGTKLGLEMNHGSKYWITFTPAADDMWTSKVGTRGEVYEAYIIQEIQRPKVSPFGKMWFRLGYQYYDFRYTGSNNWVGNPMKIDNITANTLQAFQPLDTAYDIYTTVEVAF